MLSEPDFKWAERVETLRRLHNALINIATLAAASSGGGAVNGRDDIPAALLTEVLSALTVCVTKVRGYVYVMGGREDHPFRPHLTLAPSPPSSPRCVLPSK